MLKSRALRLLRYAGLLLVGVYSLASVGRIEAAGGDVSVIARSGEIRPSTVGSWLEPGDAVSTAGAQSWAVLRMEDGASFTLRPNTRMRIDRYRYSEDHPDENGSWLSLVKGSLRAVTGLIGRQSPDSYRLNTPTATIGIRGTDHETAVIEEADATRDMPAGTYDTVNAGETVLRSDKDEQVIGVGKTGYLQREGGFAPRLLAKRPGLFLRWRQFEQRRGVLKVLGRLHQSVAGGGFTAHPDLRERLKREWQRRQDGEGGRPEGAGANAERKAERQARREARQERRAQHPHRKE
ncbi:FecR family protein [Chitinimonas naiadis]